jgi:hypothetical protein
MFLIDQAKFSSTWSHIVKLERALLERCRDESQGVGEGLVGAVVRKGEARPLLAVLPWDLYEAIKTGIDRRPESVDPRALVDSDLSCDQLEMLMAFMRLELGIEIE